MNPSSPGHQNTQVISTAESESAYLARYDRSKYDAPLCTVDMAIFTVQDAALKVLLVRRAKHPCMGKPALPGGFIDLKTDQSVEATAFRKLCGKTGVASPYLEQVGTYGGPDRDPRGWSLTILYFALIDASDIRLSAGEGADDAQWIGVNEALHLPLAFDHAVLLQQALDRLKSRTLYTSLPIHLMGEVFTLPELQEAYEIILGTTLEKKSFRKRMLAAGIIEETGQKRALISRPAMLYRACRDHHAHVFPRTLESVCNI